MPERKPHFVRCPFCACSTRKSGLLPKSAGCVPTALIVVAIVILGVIARLELDATGFWSSPLH